MNYVSFGRRKNPVVIFLHGWGGSKESWLRVAKRIAGFGFFCVAVDFPGFGKTPEPSVPYGVPEYGREVEALIEGLSLKNVTIVGHSFGGRVAIWLSAKNDVNIKRIVLVDSAGVKPRRGIVYKFKVYRYKKMKRKVVEGKASIDKLKNFGSSDFRVLSPVMQETFKKVVNLDLTNLAKGIAVDTLLIWGRRDKDTPMYMAKKLKRAIKNSRLVVYEAGHFSYLECENKFIDELYDFLIA